MPQPTPTASIRTQVPFPLRFADGYTHGGARASASMGWSMARSTSPSDWAIAPPLSRRPDAGRCRSSGLHSECLTGDVFGSQRCDCGPNFAKRSSASLECGGYLLYLRQEGRGIGLYAKLDAYALQDAGLDTYEANLALGHREDERSYLVAAQMLQALGVSRVACSATTRTRRGSCAGSG